MGCSCIAGGCKCKGPAGCIGTATIFCRGTPQGRYHEPGWCCIGPFDRYYSSPNTPLGVTGAAFHSRFIHGKLAFWTGVNVKVPDVSGGALCETGALVGGKLQAEMQEGAITVLENSTYFWISSLWGTRGIFVNFMCDYFKFENFCHLKKIKASLLDWMQHELTPSSHRKIFWERSLEDVKAYCPRFKRELRDSSVEKKTDSIRHQQNINELFREISV